MNASGAAWNELDPKMRALMEEVLTPKQLEAVKLLNAGYGTRTIARSLGVAVSSVRDRLESAERKILKALEERSGSA